MASEDDKRLTSISDPITWVKFLSTVPPSSQRRIKDFYDSLNERVIMPQQLLLYCSTESLCGRFTIFEYEDYEGSRGFRDGYNTIILLYYGCRHCQRTKKAIAVHVQKNGTAMKLGEYPPYGPVIPPRVVTLIREDRDLFFKGKTAESQGMGIGAYAYYRRVVENQKDRIIDEIIKVLKRVNESEATIAKFEEAKKETQFTKAIEQIKDALPSILLIDGQNPLTGLHSILSVGVHEMSDEECLELAESIRVILIELVNRVSEVLRERQHLKKAFSKIIQKKAKNDKG